MGQYDFQDLLSTFLRSTDQKKKSLAVILEHIVPALSAHNLFCDYGFGDGFLTEEIGAHFKRTIAVEVDQRLCEQYEQKSKLEDLIVVNEKIQNYIISGKADLILLSYVIGYLNEFDSPEQNLRYKIELFEKLVSTLSKEGVLVMINSTFESLNYRSLFDYMGIEIFDELADLENELKKRFVIEDFLVPVNLFCENVDELMKCFHLITYQVDRISNEEFEKYSEFAKKYQRNNGYLFTYESKVSIIKDSPS